ncbi:hypothetical protein MC885_019255 [Smutsia gigantea]|nr:hypothetical protein MC885_019255 [Smutsia gigantea]
MEMWLDLCLYLVQGASAHVEIKSKKADGLGAGLGLLELCPGIVRLPPQKLDLGLGLQRAVGPAHPSTPEDLIPPGPWGFAGTIARKRVPPVWAFATEYSCLEGAQGPVNGLCCDSGAKLEKRVTLKAEELCDAGSPLGSVTVHVVSLNQGSVRLWCSGCVCLDSWDDSSSVSSGISDTIDNLSTDDINTSSSISSYANTPASSRKNLDVQGASAIFESA